jgi:hypothetical protein
MAFVVRRGDQYEVRESRATPEGPRARSLATFRVLDDEVLRRAAARAERPFDATAVRRRAREIGAPEAPAGVVLAARQLLVELDRGAQPPIALRARLRKRLASAPRASLHGIGDAVDDALPWVGATDAARGVALHELLALTDRLPAPRSGARLEFPPLAGRG